MIYSQWKADGGYNYYATPARRALGSDLPSPSLPGVSPIGVPSTEIGRALPSGATKIGSGPLAKGQIVPMTSVGVLGSIGDSISNLVVVGVSIIFGYWLRGALRKGAK